MSGATHKEVKGCNEAQIAEALGPENRWYTGEAVGREPTTRECILHYITHGGAEAYRQRLTTNQPPVSGEEISG